MRTAVGRALLVLVLVWGVLGAQPVGGAPPQAPQGLRAPSVAPPDSGAGPQLPDLVPLPVSVFWIEGAVITVSLGDYLLATANQQDPFGGSTIEALRFGTTVVNGGKYSLEVVGIPRPTGRQRDPVRVEASQCVRFAGPKVEGSGRACQQYEPIGSLGWHATHGHMHIPGFAEYRLLRDVGGKPDLSPRGVVARTAKPSVCLADTDWRGPANPVDMGWYRDCRHLDPSVPAALRMGISPGWGSSTMAVAPGQFIALTQVPDGYYWIAVMINQPDAKGRVAIRESNLANNVSYKRIRVRTKHDESKREAWQG